MWQLYIDFTLFLRIAPYLFSPAEIKGWTGRTSTWMSCWWRATSWSAGCLRRKKWDVLVSIGSFSEWLENARGYCCNLRSCTDSNRNMLPARKNQDTFVIILSILRGSDLMNHNRAIIVVSALKPDYDGIFDAPYIVELGIREKRRIAWWLHITAEDYAMRKRWIFIRYREHAFFILKYIIFIEFARYDIYDI